MRLFLTSLVGGLMASFVLSGAAMARTATPENGTLIRGETFSAVYYMGADGFRYVFPNEKTYFTWYHNFNDVVWISDETLAEIQIGGNVTYKPGVKMVKIQSDPKTYAVSQHGTLRWVTSESIATSLYGSSWNANIDDVPDGFFTNYTISDPIVHASEYDPDEQEDNVSSINEDKGISEAQEVSITASGDYSPSNIVIDAGTVIRFENNDAINHTATADDNSWGTGTISPGDSFLRRFDEAGIFPFFCSYHPEMQGLIVVE